MSNYATKADLKDGTGADISDFAKNTDLANLKSDVDKLDVDKLKNVPSGLSNLKSKVDKLALGKLETTLVDLSKLSDVVKNEVVKKTGYDELVKKAININPTDTGDLVKKLNITQRLIKLKRKLLFMVMVNILLLKYLIN